MNDEHPFALLPDYSVESLPPAQARLVEQHLEHCSECQARLETLRATASLLQSLPAPALPRSFALSAREGPPVRSHPWRLSTAFLSAAAVLFLALGLSFASLGRSSAQFSTASHVTPVAYSAAATTSAAAASSAASAGPAERGAAAAPAPPAAGAGQASASSTVRPLAAARAATQSAAASEKAPAANAAQARATAVPGSATVPPASDSTARQEPLAVARTPALLQGIRLALAIAAVLCLLAALAAFRAAFRRRL